MTFLGGTLRGISLLPGNQAESFSSFYIEIDGTSITDRFPKADSGRNVTKLIIVKSCAWGHGGIDLSM